MRNMPKIPIIGYFSFSYRVYDAITTYAYQKNKSICTAMQDFIEYGLYTYFEYDPALKERFNSHSAPAPSPSPPTCDHAPL